MTIRLQNKQSHYPGNYPSAANLTAAQCQLLTDRITKRISDTLAAQARLNQSRLFHFSHYIPPNQAHQQFRYETWWGSDEDSDHTEGFALRLSLYFDRVALNSSHQACSTALFRFQLTFLSPNEGKIAAIWSSNSARKDDVETLWQDFILHWQKVQQAADQRKMSLDKALPRSFDSILLRQVELT